MMLDKKRPYGIITGHDHAKYEQDGVLYKPDGTPILPKNTLTLKGTKNGMELGNKQRQRSGENPVGTRAIHEGPGA
jgi:hypothetical protein